MGRQATSLKVLLLVILMAVAGLIIGTSAVVFAGPPLEIEEVGSAVLELSHLEDSVEGHVTFKGWVPGNPDLEYRISAEAEDSDPWNPAAPIQLEAKFGGKNEPFSFCTLIDQAGSAQGNLQLAELSRDALTGGNGSKFEQTITYRATIDKDNPPTGPEHVARVTFTITRLD